MADEYKYGLENEVVFLDQTEAWDYCYEHCIWTQEIEMVVNKKGRRLYIVNLVEDD